MTGRADSSPYPAGARTFARFARPRTATPHAVAVLSDLHFSTVDRGTSKQLHRTEARLDRAVGDLTDRDVDAVVCLGDLVQRGRPADFDEVSDRLDALEPPVYAVPGNHDLTAYERAEGLPLSAFADRFAPASYPFAVSVGDLSLCGLAAVDGRVDPAALSALEDRISSPEAAILCLHFPTTPVVTRLRRALSDPSVVRSHRVVDALSAFDESAVPLALTGHLHVPLVARSRDRTHLAAPPLCTYPQGYLLLRTGPAGCRVAFVPVADPESLAQSRVERARHSAVDRRLASFAADAMASLPFEARGGRHPASDGQ